MSTPIPFQIKVAPDRIIRGDLFPSRTEAQGTLIMAHGFKGFKDWGFFPHAAASLAEFMDVVTFNFSHSGVGADLQNFTELEKFAVNTYSLVQEDLHTIVTAVRSGNLPLSVPSLDRHLPDNHLLDTRSPDPHSPEARSLDTRSHDIYSSGALLQPSTRRLYLLGFSKGGGSSLIYAFDHPGALDGVISWNGIAYVDLFSDSNKAEMRATGRSSVPNTRTHQDMPLDVCILDDMEANRERFAIVERSKQADLPIALIQTAGDSAKSRAGNAAMAADNPRIRHILLSQGNHPFDATHPFRGETPALAAVIQATKTFLQEKLYNPTK
jgi:hypothetical protein